MFTVKVHQQIHGVLKIRHNKSNPPNGNVERCNRTVLATLSLSSKMIGTNHLSLKLGAYRSAIHASTGINPPRMYCSVEMLTRDTGPGLEGDQHTD